MKKEAKRRTPGKQCLKKLSHRLTLKKETLQNLHGDRLSEVAGGRTRNTCGIACTAVNCI